MRKYICICSLLIVFILSSCGGSDFYKVKSVVNGNTIQLLNGYQVILLGIDDSSESKLFLENAVANSSVKLRFDKNSPQSLNRYYDKIAYAYVINRGKCINSDMLKNKKSDLLEHTYLKDSLEKYRTYAGVKAPTKPDSQRIIAPIPIAEPDDIDLSQWTYHDNGQRNDLYLTNNCEWNCNVLSYVCDFNSSITRSFATQIAKKSPGEYNIGQVCEIYKYLRTRWKYVSDPRGREYLALASESIAGTKLGGDCDDFAILMYSVITAIGGKARINFAWNVVEKTGHAYTEVFLNDFDESSLIKDIQKQFPYVTVTELWYSESSSGKWLNLDWTAEYPGGPYFKANEIMRYHLNDGGWICG